MVFIILLKIKSSKDSEDLLEHESKILKYL